MLLQIPSISSIPAQYLGGVLIIIAVVLSLGIYRGLKGMKYTKTNVYRRPIMYFVVTLFGLAVLNPSYIDATASLATLIAGYIIGRRLAGGVKFFDKNGTTFYTRSPFIMVIWLVSYIARFGIAYAYPESVILAVVVEIVLAGTTGMIIGEAHHINSSYEQYAARFKKSARYNS